MHQHIKKTEEFKKEYRKRARIEGKNAEMKRFHGLTRANGYGLEAVSKQAKLTAIAVNLKKIAKLISLNFDKTILKSTKINFKKFALVFRYYFLKFKGTFSVVRLRPQWQVSIIYVPNGLS